MVCATWSVLTPSAPCPAAASLVPQPNRLLESSVQALLLFASSDFKQILLVTLWSAASGLRICVPVGIRNSWPCIPRNGSQRCSRTRCRAFLRNCCQRPAASRPVTLWLWRRAPRVWPGSGEVDWYSLRCRRGSGSRRCTRTDHETPWCHGTAAPLATACRGRRGPLRTPRPGSLVPFSEEYEGAGARTPT